MNILAHLVNQFARSPEDVATEGLVKILRESALAGAAINGLLEAWGGTLKAQDWKSQVAANDGARTDVEGYANGQLVVILENKFWAGLTDNQPKTYLERLPEGGILIFVAPERRRESLKYELTERSKEESVSFENDRAMLKAGKLLIVTSWEVIINAIERKLGTVASEESLLSDCQQLKGMAEYFGKEGFLTFTTGELTGNTSRVVLQLIDVIDGAVNTLISRGASIKGYKTTATANGYTRYFDMSGLGCQLDLNFGLWKEYGRSPVWFRVAKISPTGWIWDASLRAFMDNSARFAIENPKGMNPGLWQTIRIKEGHTRNQVVDNIASQVEEILANGGAKNFPEEFKVAITTALSESEVHLDEPASHL